MSRFGLNKKTSESPAPNKSTTLNTSVNIVSQNAMGNSRNAYNTSVGPVKANT